ncbi:unnamed protein product [Chironomus riparius]|uniref:Secreted protein n=1 Tax=Chironomus riparius TaxID=315576 RepID=A0A9N9RGB5_9DIPT|nr:unnamed protein product [Chironomus riparius]
MKCLNIIVLLSLAGSALGGGDSTCQSIHENFMALVQVVETSMNVIVNYISGIILSYPQTGSTYIEYLNCHLNELIYTLIDGTSQMSGTDYDYIYGIFTNEIEPPFTAPLDCIQSELLDFKQFIMNLNPIFSNLSSLVTDSTINENTPCSEVQTFFQTYFLAGQGIANKIVNISLEDAAGFKSIGRLNLYLEHHVNISACGAIAFSNGIAELLNMDVTIVNEYLANSSTPVPPPLSCVKGSVTSISNLINTSNNQFNATVVASPPPPNCEPFYTKFKTFSNIWYNYINSLQAFVTNNSIAFPVLTPVFIIDFVCELHTLVILAANATSVLSGIDSEVIYEIINGTVPLPFVEPLDCIATDLINMRNHILLMSNDVIPGLSDFTQVSTSDTSTCNNTYTSLTSYATTLVTLANRKGVLVMSASEAFISINLGDLFLESFASILECLPDILGTYVGSALHSNSNPLISYLRGDTLALPYPFSCVKIIITILSSLMNQAIVDFITASPVDLAVPNIPVYRG